MNHAMIAIMIGCAALVVVFGYLLIAPQKKGR